MLVVLAVLFVAFAAGCTDSGEVGPDPAAGLAQQDQGGSPITVIVRLPESGHMDSVQGSIVDAEGAEVAVFKLEAGFVFLEDSSASNDYRPATSMVEGATQAAVELPVAGEYRFSIDDVFYWGGCGTCGRAFAGGEVTRDVRDGSVIDLDLGESTGAS